MYLARLRPVARTGSHLDTVWAIPVGIKQLRGKVLDGVMLEGNVNVFRTLPPRNLTLLWEWNSRADDEFSDPLKWKQDSDKILPAFCYHVKCQK